MVQTKTKPKGKEKIKAKTKEVAKAKTNKKIEEKVGRVVQVIGPVVDIEFKSTELPEIYNALRVTSDGLDTPIPVNIVLRWSCIWEKIRSDAFLCIPPMAWPGE